MIEASVALSALIPEKIKKFATIARMTELIISAKFVLLTVNREVTDPLSNKRIGRMIITVATELKNKSAIGERP
jgi:Na+-transporting NADH:ubiquinone oxidoreductase subunit NqrB